MGNNDNAGRRNGDDASRFTSVAALKAAHSALLRRYREGLGAGSVHDNNAQGLSALLPDIKNFIALGRETGAYIEAEDERAASQAYLDYWVSVVYRAGLERDESAHYEATLADFNPNLAPSLPEEACPYVGLDTFQEQNRNIFFGRETLVEEMLKRLDAERLLAVVGSSGSGKSSAVLAGLLPALKAGRLEGSGGWNYYPPMIPGANPLLNLALAVMPEGERQAIWVEKQAELFMGDAGHLRGLLEENAPGRPSVLIIDQFEEIFTLCNDEALLSAFVNNLLGLVTDEGLQHRIILTMRTEFQEQMPRLDALYQLFQKGLVQIMALSESGVREAIERPAERAKLEFQKGVVDSLVKEIVGEPAGLPLLQFTLLELWRRRNRNRITMDAYESLGGARRALTNCANRFYEGLFPAEQVVAQRIFLRLSWTGDGVEVLRNRACRRELRKVGGSSDQVDAVLQKLVEARLVRLSRDEFAVGDRESLDDRFEVAHEALIRNWLVRATWFQAERDTLRQRVRLRSAAEQWKLHQEDPGGLLGGSLLDEALQYTDLDDLENKFVQKSKDAQESAQQEQEAARLRELTRLQELANEKTRANKWLWGFAVVLLVGMLSSGGLASYAWSKERQAKKASEQAVLEQSRAVEQSNLAQVAKAFADEQRIRAETEAEEVKRQKAAAEEAKIEADVARAASEGARIKITEQAAALKLKGEELARTIDLLKQKGDKLTETIDLLEAANKRAGDNLLEARRIAEVLKKERDKLEEEKTKKENALKEAEENLKLAQKSQTDLNLLINDQGRELKRANAALASQIAFSADASRLLTASDGRARVWDTKTRSLLRTASLDEVYAASLSADGKRLVATKLTGQAVVVDVASGNEIELTGLPNVPAKLILSGDARKLAAFSYQEGVVRIFDLKSFKLLKEFKDLPDPPVNIAFSADGQQLAFTDNDAQTTLVGLGAGISNKQLGTGVCRQSSLELLNFSPSPDLKASLKLESICKGTSREQSERISPKVKAELSKILTTKTAKPATALPQPKPEETTPLSPAIPVPEWANGESQSDVLQEWRIFFDVQKRGADGTFYSLGTFEYSSNSDIRAAGALEKLTDEGISDDDVEDISEKIVGYAEEFDKTPGEDSDPAKTAKLEQLTLKLYKDIMDELDIPLQK